MALFIIFKCPECEENVEGHLGVWAYCSSESESINDPILLMPQMADSCGLYACYIECPKCENTIDIMR